MLEPRIIIGLSHGNNAAKTCKSKKENTFHTHYFQCFVRTNIVTFCFTSNVFGQKNGGWKKQIGPIAAQKDRATINLSTCLLVNCQSNYGRMHGPCVPTCTQTNRAISHVTRQYGHDSGVGTHGSCVRSRWNETQIRGCRIGRTVRASVQAIMYVRVQFYLSGRTSGASLHFQFGHIGF